MSATVPVSQTPPPAPAPMCEYRSTWEHAALYAFIIVPFLAVLLGMALAIDGSVLSPLTAALTVGFYLLTAHGVTIGYHRLFTHRSFKAARPLKIALALAGSMAVQGGVIRWVADHRKHHQNADSDGDPHSPWRYGSGARNLARGLWWAHTGWLLQREQAAKSRYAPDLLADRDLRRVHDLFPVWTGLTVVLPPGIALAATGGSWPAAGQAVLWASLVRIFLLHHVTFSINSLCHVIGRRPSRTRDRSTNLWPLALLSMGESWHNTHHSDPGSARHGADRWQVDSSARLIWVFEKLGWARDVRWPNRPGPRRRR